MPSLDTTNTTTAETAVAKIWGDHAFHVLNLWHLGEYAPKETADIGILLFAPRMPPGRCSGPLPAMRIRFHDSNGPSTADIGHRSVRATVWTSDCSERDR